MVPGKVSLWLVAFALTCVMSSMAAAQPIVRLEGGYGVPQKWFGGASLHIDLGRESALMDPGGWAFETDASVGQGAWKVGAGVKRCCLGILGIGVGDTGVGAGLGSTLGARGVFTRTRGAPRGIEADRSLIGVEMKYSFLLLLDLSAGVMFPLGTGTAKGPVFTWGVGVGWPLLF